MNSLQGRTGKAGNLKRTRNTSAVLDKWNKRVKEEPPKEEEKAE